jgi:hypothetical protein
MPNRKYRPTDAPQPTFQPGQLVKTPLGRGVVQHYFPAFYYPSLATYTVKIPRFQHAKPFKVGELREAGR